jgi:hypothetical protein
MSVRPGDHSRFVVCYAGPPSTAVHIVEPVLLVKTGALGHPGAPFLSIDAEHLVGYASDLDLAPDRAPAGQLVIAPQLGDPG